MKAPPKRWKAQMDFQKELPLYLQREKNWRREQSRQQREQKLSLSEQKS